MSTSINAAVLALLVCTQGRFEPVATPQLSEPGQLDRRIGSPKPRMFRAIRESSEWKNPFLIIHRDGIEVIGSGSSSGGRIVTATELKRALIELPITAWPYGRVVAVQEIGLRAPNGTDDSLITANLEATRAVLKAIDVTIERWPS